MSVELVYLSLSARLQALMEIIEGRERRRSRGHFEALIESSLISSRRPHTRGYDTSVVRSGLGRDQAEGSNDRNSLQKGGIAVVAPFLHLK